MPKTWTKLESWEPQGSDSVIFKIALGEKTWSVYNAGRVEYLRRKNVLGFKSRAAALRAANKQNRLDGLPEVQ